MEVGPSVDPVTGAITFVALSPPSQRPLRVWFHLRDFGADPTFSLAGPDLWSATIPAPPVDRLEYLLVSVDGDGTETMAPDPGNPHVVAGPFGEKSVLELPGYRTPRWLMSTSDPWAALPLEFPTSEEGIAVVGELLSPPGSRPSDSLPLLVVHDGPEYSRLAGLGDYLTWLSGGSPELSCRALLLKPVDRDLSYAASATYAAALVDQGIPAAQALLPSTGAVVGLGASLGALALAHAAATYPGTFGGLLCQSGSFFRPEYDAHEQRFRYYDRVVSAVDVLHAAPTPLRGLEMALTAGTGEENLENNQAFAQRLRQLGVAVTLTTGRDGHNHTGWRDLLHPALGSLLSRVWGH